MLFLRRSLALISLGLPLLALTGCDLGVYEQRRQAAAGTLAQEAKQGQLLGLNTYVVDGATKSTGMSLILPSAVGSTPKAPVAGSPGAIAGMAFLYETDATGAGPSVFIGGVPSNAGPIDQTVVAVDAAVKAISPGAQVAMVDGPVPGSKRITSKWAQSFQIGGAPQNVDGRTEALVVPTATHYAIVIYRSSKAAGDGGFYEATDLSIRSAKVDAAPPAAPAGT